ncbi:MAG TPA: hypothetical protein VG605_12980 [Puia sp.]|jgi:hypothetical protein|nr:hypothetical protein [Puia sp.]
MNRKFLLVVLGIGGVVLYLSSCSKESADRLAGTTTCDTTNVSYSKQIVPILEDNCYTCHQGNNPPSGIDLSDFATLQAHVRNGDLKSAVTHTGNVTPMPYGLPMLPSCEVNTIVAWVDQGALNN